MHFVCISFIFPEYLQKILWFMITGL